MISKKSIYVVFACVCVLFSACNSDDDSATPDPNLGSPCDSAIAIDDSNPANAVKAFDLCQATTASYIRANGNSTAHSTQIGILSSFGSNLTPARGERMLMLSTGAARGANQPDACGGDSCNMSGMGNAPVGFPQSVSGCPTSGSIYDDIGLEVTVTVPEGANSFSFDFVFYTFDYPELVCSAFNDQFVVLLGSNPTGAVNGNIALDGEGMPISVNSEFIDPTITDIMDLTGFGSWGDAATTGWIRTSAPVTPGNTITLKFLIWDAGDQNLDSSVIIDNFRWLSQSSSVQSNRVL